jgi:fumarate hydratase class II
MADLADKPGYRLDKDALGPVYVPSDRLWGAQTPR